MWKFIQGTDNKMIITSTGRIFRRYPIRKGWNPKRIVGWSEFREVKPRLVCGYLQVNLSGIRIPKLVHRLVAETFIPNPLGLRDVDHIDGNKTNNRVENLRWVTHKENCNNPNTKYKGVYSSNRKFYTGIQGFNLKTNHRTPVFRDCREASGWITPEGKKINLRSLLNALNWKITYYDYLWTAKLVTGEEYQDIIST